MSTPNEFVRPASGELFSPSKHQEWMGKLFMIRPNFVESIVFDPTAGPKEIVNAFVVILDLQGPPDGRPVVIDGAQIGGAGLAPQIKNKINQLVLGRLEQGPQQGQKSGTFKLNPNFTDADAAAASAWLAQYGPVPPVPEAPAPAPVAAPQAPAQPWAQQAPAAQQWGAQPQVQAPAQQAWGQPPAPEVPAAQQWQAPQAPAQQWGNSNQPAPDPAAQQWNAPAAPVQDPALVAFLVSKGVVVTPDMTESALIMIANSFPK